LDEQSQSGQHQRDRDAGDEDDEEPRSGSARRRAHATRLVEMVVTTLTARQQQVYQLRYVGELTGRQVAEQLGISDKTASNENAPDEVGTTAFTTALRERIVRHFDNCNICDDCRTCNTKRRELVGPYVPATIPILFAADLHDRITEMIDRITRQADPDPHSHRPGSRPPADADAIRAAREPGGPRSAGGAGLAAVLLAAAPELVRSGGTRLQGAARRRPMAAAGIVVLAVVAVTGTSVALASGGGSGSGSKASARSSGRSPWRRNRTRSPRRGTF
jgi:Sigma-70, region 4